MGQVNTTLEDNMVIGCGCAMCAQQQVGGSAIPNDENSSSGTSGDPLYAPSGEATPDQFADYLTDGYWQDVGRTPSSWNKSTITFSISNEFTAAQKAGLINAFDLWDDVADINFVQVTSGADISVVEGDDGRAYSSSSISGGVILSNTISIDTAVAGWRNFDEIGDYALMTALHEIGHSLGLGHTGNYNGSASYTNDAQWTNDTHQMTVMSYFNASNVGSDHRDSSNQYQYSAAPMLIDIVAIQNLYGANYNTRNGDTIYGFNATAGHAQFDFSISEAPVAIWDGGGIDTLDLSGYNTNQTIHLTSGFFSSVGHMTNNLVIAYGADIENAIGGTGDDSIYGNDFNNTILGGAGADTLYGTIGDDILDGESGTDIVEYNYSVNDFAFDFISNVQLRLSNIIDSFTDLVSNVEQFIFSDGAYTFAELNSLFNLVEEAQIELIWGTGSYNHTSSDRGTETLTATDIGYAFSSGDQISIYRDRKNISIEIKDENAPDDLRLVGSAEKDIIYIGGTHSSISVEVIGNGGNDIINVSVVGNGNDNIYGMDGNDIIKLQSAGNTAYGGNDNDQIWSSFGDDLLYGEAGNDSILSRGGNNLIDGGSGNDTVNYRYTSSGVNADLSLAIASNNGSGGADVLTSIENVKGSNFNDVIVGIRNSKLFGLDGDDILYAADGYEVLNGGRGNDTLYIEESYGLFSGGTGADTFVFESINAYPPVIRDFNTAQNDVLDISAILSGVYNSATDAIEDFIQITDDGRHSFLAVDSDGGGDSFQIIATLNNVTGLTDEQSLEINGNLIA